MNNNIPEITPGIPPNAVSIYGQGEDALDEFPVLKAFQQYIDAEQAKARKRLLIICLFLGFVMFVMTGVFVLTLFNMSSRNQTLNDRLVEYAMKERERASETSAAILKTQQENDILKTMTARLDEFKKQLTDAQKNTAKIVEPQQAEKPKGPTKEELEIERLKTLLAAEKQKLAAEQEKQRQIELEAYRRKHYPELYETKEPLRPAPIEPAVEKKKSVRQRIKQEMDEADQEIEAILNDADAISYFDDDSEEAERPRKAKTRTSKKRPVQSPSSNPDASENNYSIPVDVKGSSSNWSIPLE